MSIQLPMNAARGAHAQLRTGLAPAEMAGLEIAGSMRRRGGNALAEAPPHLDLILGLARLAVLVLLLGRYVEAAVLDHLGQDLRVDIGDGDDLVAANLCGVGGRRRWRRKWGGRAQAGAGWPARGGQPQRRSTRLGRPEGGSLAGPSNCSRGESPGGSARDQRRSTVPPPSPSMVFRMVTLCLATSASTSKCWVSELSSLTCSGDGEVWVRAGRRAGRTPEQSPPSPRKPPSLSSCPPLFPSRVPVWRAGRLESRVCSPLPPASSLSPDPGRTPRVLRPAAPPQNPASRPGALPVSSDIYSRVRCSMTARCTACAGSQGPLPPPRHVPPGFECVARATPLLFYIFHLIPEVPAACCAVCHPSGSALASRPAASALPPALGAAVAHHPQQHIRYGRRTRIQSHDRNKQITLQDGADTHSTGALLQLRRRRRPELRREQLVLRLLRLLRLLRCLHPRRLARILRLHDGAGAGRALLRRYRVLRPQHLPRHAGRRRLAAAVIPAAAASSSPAARWRRLHVHALLLLLL